MFIDKKILIDDQIGLILKSKTSEEIVFLYEIKPSEHNWIEFWVGDKTKQYFYVTAFEIAFTQHEVIFKFIHPDIEISEDTIIHTISVPEQMFFESMLVGDKTKLTIWLEYD